MNIDKLIKKFGKYKYAELEFIVNSYMNGSINDEKMTEWLKRVCKKGLSIKETIDLTDIYIKSGEVIDLSVLNRPTVDKHSTGGIGDKISLIVGPIVASLGICVPKMSGRGLGFTGGTIDKLESIDGFRVNLTKEEFLKQLSEINVGIISQTESIALADKKIYALRDVTGTIESTALIAASIMSKKIACGSSTIVIDLKVGKGAFAKNLKEARKLALYLKAVGKHYNRNVTCVLTKMDSPLGESIGNNLEVMEAMRFFDGSWNPDLGEVALSIATQMVHLSLNISEAEAIKKIKTSIEDGAARKKFYQWIEYQGGNINTIVKSCKKMVIKTKSSGYIKDIDALKIGSLVRDLGGGRINKEDKIDYAAGVKILKDIGTLVREGDTIAEVYFNNMIPNIESRCLEAFTYSPKQTKDKSSVIAII